MVITQKRNKTKVTTSDKPSRDTGYRKYIIIGRYQKLVISRTGLPLFVSFYPNNIVKFTLKKVHKDKLKSFLTSIENWFENLRILKIEEEIISD